MPKLLITSGEKKGYVFRLSDDIVSIGRASDNTIAIPDRSVSRNHATIFPHGEEYVIEDLSSKNGTYVNGAKVPKHTLKVGDEIKLGLTTIAFLHLSAPEEIGKPSRVSVVSGDEAPKDVTVEMLLPPDHVKPLEAVLEKFDSKEVRHSYHKLMTLYRISHDIGTLVELKELLEKIIHLVMEITKADYGFIMLVDDESGELIPQASSKREGVPELDTIPVSETITNRVLESGKSVITSDATADLGFKESKSVLVQEVRSAMCSPIKSKARILGIMYVDTKSSSQGFVKEDLELLTAICNQAAMAIDNAKLFDNLKKANLELKERQAQLIETEKLSALGQLASGVAHEINNPLATIMGYADLMLKKFSDGKLKADDVAKYSKYLKIVEDEARRCQKVTQNLLQFSRRKKIEVSPIDINDTIEAALAVAQYHNRNKLTKITKRFSPDLLKITADGDKLQQVFLNIVINAMDSMEDGGTLTITTKSRGSRWVEAKFKDTGCGIPEDKLDEIFDPLYTTKEEGRGTGLGLSISQEIIKQHNGTIDVKSTVGKGTVFSVVLPVKL